jgi:hypothetical protein
MAVFLGLRSYSSLISLAIGPVITIETVLLAIAKLAKPTKVPFLVELILL